MRGKKVTNLRNKLNGVNERFNIKNSKYHAKCLQLNKAYRKIEIMREALNRDCELLDKFLQKLPPEAVGNPNLNTAHMGMIEFLHCGKRAELALKKVDELK